MSLAHWNLNNVYTFLLHGQVRLCVYNFNNNNNNNNNDTSNLPNFFLIFFYANHPLQGFRSHCSVRGYYSLLVATAGAEATTRTGRQHTHAHTHTQPPTQPFITSKHDMKSLLVREQVDGSTVLSTKTKYIQGHSTKLLLPEGTMV